MHSSQGASIPHDTAPDEYHHPDGSLALSPAMERLQAGLQALRYQHSALLQTLHPNQEPGSSLRASPLLAIAKEEDEIRSVTPTFSTLGKASVGSHRLSSQSDASIWYDAPEYDGAEEFVLDELPVEDSQTSKLSDKSNSEVTTPDADAESSNIWQDSESDTEDDVPPEPPKSAPSDNVQAVVRRAQLPSLPVGDEGSLFTVLKKNVGKVQFLYVLVGCAISKLLGTGSCTSRSTSIVQRTPDTPPTHGRRARILRPSQ